jgi:hypothetical protein
MNTCSICRHPDRPEIENALESRTLRDLARQYHVSKDSLARHRTKCMEEARIKNIALTSQARILDENDMLDGKTLEDPLAEMVRLKNDSLRILRVAENAGNIQLMVLMIREVRMNLESMMRIAEVQQRLSQNRKDDSGFTPSFVYRFLKEKYPSVLAELIASAKVIMAEEDRAVVS